MEPTTNEPQESYKIKTCSPIELQKEERHFVLSSFIMSLRSGNDMFKLIDQDHYYEAYNRYMDQLINRPKVIVKMAHLNYLTTIGWSLIEGDTLHYVYVKKDARRQGVGSSLIPNNIKVFSHITHKGLSIWASKYPNLRFNPFV